MLRDTAQDSPCVQPCSLGLAKGKSPATGSHQAAYIFELNIHLAFQPELIDGYKRILEGRSISDIPNQEVVLISMTVASAQWHVADGDALVRLVIYPHNTVGARLDINEVAEVGMHVERRPRVDDQVAARDRKIGGFL